MPAHIGIPGNETTDGLSKKKTRDQNWDYEIQVADNDANAMAR